MHGTPLTVKLNARSRRFGSSQEGHNQQSSVLTARSARGCTATVYKLGMKQNRHTWNTSHPSCSPLQRNDSLLHKGGQQPRQHWAASDCDAAAHLATAIARYVPDILVVLDILDVLESRYSSIGSRASAVFCKCSSSTSVLSISF